MLTNHLSIAALTLAATLAMPALAGPRFVVTALPAGTTVSGLNELGQVAGSIGSGGLSRGYLWSPAGLVQANGPGDQAFATAINNAGTLAGYTVLPDFDFRSFTYRDGSTTPLQIFGSSFHYASAINDAEQLAGAYALNGDLRAYRYSNGSALDLGTLGGSFSSANGINSAGDVVGFSSLDDDDVVSARAFLYANGVMRDLGALGEGNVSEATAINDRGQITGHSWVAGNSHAFLYEQGAMRDLGTLGGRYSFAYDINNAGQVVGWSNDPNDEFNLAFLYEGGSMLDLNTLIDPGSGWVLLEARGINDRQQIAAFGCRADVCGGVLLDPAPQPIGEPAPIMLVLSGLGLMGWRRVSGAYRYAGCRPRRTDRRT